MAAYYNENDPKAAAWLRELIKKGLIAPGEVDERSIEDVRPADVAGFRQAHWFAGIGGWSYALRLAGWPDDKPVWTGSCPCQPFSAAGKRGGTADERHLWPAFWWLINQCRPATVFGEQVASKGGREWLAGVRADLEAVGYAVGAADLCAAGVGAPHIRQRLWWVADAASPRHDGTLERTKGETRHQARMLMPRPNSADGGVAESDRGQRIGLAGSQGGEPNRAQTGWQQGHGEPECSCAGGGVADAKRHAPEPGRPANESGESAGAAATGPHAEPGRCGLPCGLEHPTGDGWSERRAKSGGRCAAGGCGAGWGNAVWLPCADGKVRRIEPGAQPLVDGLSESLERCGDLECRAIDEVEAYAFCSNTSAEEILRAVRQRARAEAIQWPSRGSDGVSEPTILFAFVSCLLAALSASSERAGQPQTRKAIHFRAVRFVRLLQRLDRTPYRWRRDEQRSVEHSDALQALSQFLARHAKAYREEAERTYAATGRVGLLRGYGNAIVPQVAAQFISAYLGAK